MKVKKSTWLPVVLLIYLAVMSYIGYPGYVSGQFSALEYFGIIGLTILTVTLLHFSLKRKERLRREREQDMDHKSPSHKKC